MPTLITEAGTLTPTNTGRLEITLITPGWGSSGYYSAQMLEQAATDRVFPRGTQMHIDHMGNSERMENSAGSLRTLASVLTEDATWDPDYVDPDTGGKGRLVAESLLGSQYRETITEFADYIGTSISAGADVSIGEAEGRKGQIIESLIPSALNRVDFVTVAGRGGRIAGVLEAAVNRIAEATANDTREALSVAVREAYGSEDGYTWVLDYDETNVWFSEETSDESKTWQSGYTMTDTTATLIGSLVEVRRVTTYTPITPPAADAAAESKEFPSDPAGEQKKTMEENMAKIEVDEAVHTAAVEASGRVTALEAELLESKAREAKLIESTNKATAASVVKEAFADVEAPETVKFLSESFTLNEDGSVNIEALKARAETVAAEAKVNAGAGSVRGVGSTDVDESKEITEESARDQILAARGYTPKGAK